MKGNEEMKKLDRKILKDLKDTTYEQLMKMKNCFNNFVVFYFAEKKNRTVDYPHNACLITSVGVIHGLYFPNLELVGSYEGQKYNLVCIALDKNEDPVLVLEKNNIEYMLECKGVVNVVRR